MRRVGLIAGVALAAAALAVYALFAGGGGDDGPRLPAADREAVTTSEVDIANFCRLAAQDGEGGVDLKLRPFNDSRIVMELSVDKLIALYRQSPEAIFQPGSEGERRTMRRVLGDAAVRLRDRCGPDGREQARRIDRVLGG